MSKLLFFAASVGYASAECANSCSGHGHCTNYAAQFSTYPVAMTQLPAVSVVTGAAINALGYDVVQDKKDSCTCFTHTGFSGSAAYQFTGADCSLKTCPHAQSYNGPALSTNADTTVDQAVSHKGNLYHTQHVECSDKGLCNRKTGICECFDGYTGSACQLTSCPNDCSESGSCTVIWQIVEDVKENANYYGNYLTTVSYTAFDMNALQGCVCDAGRSGPDCSMIDCPSGSDPLLGGGSESGRVCSGRGNCDWSTGECDCFAGYHGSSCGSQRNQAV